MCSFIYSPALNTNTHKNAQKHAYTDIHTYTQACTYTQIHTHIHIHTYQGTCTCVYTLIHSWMHIYSHINTCKCKSIHIYTYADTHTSIYTYACMNTHIHYSCTQTCIHTQSISCAFCKPSFCSTLLQPTGSAQARVIGQKTVWEGARMWLPFSESRLPGHRR